MKKISLTGLEFQVNGQAFTLNLAEGKEEDTTEEDGTITTNLADVVWNIRLDGMNVEVNGVYLFGVDG